MAVLDCYHCGLPVDPNAKFTAIILDEPRDMCCPGCKAVAETIVESGLEDYYRFRTAPAEQGDQALSDTLAQLAIYDEPALQDEFVHEQGDLKEIQLTVEGITCAACGWLIEKQLSKVEGVKQVAVNVAQRRAFVSWNDNIVTLSGVLQAINKIGYPSLPFQPDQHESLYKKEQKTFLKKLGLAGLMTMQVMMLMAGMYFDLFGAIENETRQFFNWIAAVLTTPVVLYSGSVFYVGASKALSARSVNMDVPVTIAIFGTYLAGLKSVLTEVGDVYFESICMFVFLLLLSRYLEHRSRYKAAQISANMMQHMPVTAHVLDDDGNIEQCLAKQLEPEQRVFVKAGEIIPVDGIVIDGVSAVDEAMLTGEFEPVNKTIGDTVYGGTVSQSGALTVKVTQSLKNALVSQIIRLQSSAMASKPTVAATADTFSRYFVTAVLVIAAVTFGFWSIQGSEDAFWITISVLVATCPCALGLATPSALTCAMARLNKSGVLLKRADALEQLTSIDTIALDKTGTLTQGQFSIGRHWFSDKSKKDAYWAIACALESRSEHPIASAFDLKSVSSSVKDFSVVAGKGVKGNIDGTDYLLGSKAFVGTDNDVEWANVYLTDTSGQCLAAFEVTDHIKPGIKGVLDNLDKYALCVVSGDTYDHVNNVAQQLGITQVYSEQTPEDKYNTIAQLQAQGHSVLMLGDGINDAPVLASADVSAAVGNASDVAKNAADVILLSDALDNIPALLTTAQKTKLKIKQNIGWAVGYNVLILPFAVSGLLTPWLAVIGMSLSSIIVVSNSTRLLK